MLEVLYLEWENNNNLRDAQKQPSSKQVNSDTDFNRWFPAKPPKNQIQIGTTKSLPTKHVPRALHTHERSYTRSMDKHG